MSIIDPAEEETQRAMRPVRIQIANMLRRSVVRLVNDSKMLQTLQLFVTGTEDEGTEDDPEDQDEIEHFEHYGLTTWLPRGAEALLARIAGEKAVQVVFGTAYREARPKLAAEKDVTIWDADGQKIELKRDKIVITLNGANDLELGAGATKGVARDGDGVVSNTTIDSAFWSWVTAVSGLLSIPFPPQTLGSEIDEGSDVVKAVD